MNYVAIIRKAEKQKFGRTSTEQWAKRVFIQGVLFALCEMPEAYEQLNAAGYNVPNETVEATR